ncbi:MAG: amidohydrolase family protein [Pseudomonadota bacterium]
MRKDWVAAVGVLILAGFAVGCASVPSRDNPGAVILENVNIVDAEKGIIQENQSILIADGVIAEISSSVQSEWPDYARRPVVSGLYVTPALIDAHVHLFDERDLQMYSTFGVMAVRNMDGWDWHLRLRDRTDAINTRADLVTAGAQFQGASFKSSDDLREKIQREQTRGYDWVKLYDDVDISALQVVSDLTLQSGAKVTGHLPDDIDAAQAISTGAYGDIAHAEELLGAMRVGSDDWRSGLDQVADAMLHMDTALTTTLVNNKMIDDQRTDFTANLARAEVHYAPPLLQVFWASEYNPYRSLDQSSHDGSSRSGGGLTPLLLELVGALDERGVTVLAGTDAPNPTTIPGFALHEELDLLAQAGISSPAILKSATTDASDRIFGGRRHGRIGVGATANVIITDKNPLSDITALARFNALLRKGVYQPRSAILAEREALASIYAHDRLALAAFSPASADAVIDYIKSNGGADAISREALTSLIWAYMKFGDMPEARRIAAFQLRLFPSSQDAKWVAGYLASQ